MERKLNELEKQPTWKYILAWIVFFGSVNLMTLGIETFLVTYALEGLITIEAVLWTSISCMLPLMLINCFITYEKLFVGLNLYSVWKWFVGLGSLLTASNLGNSISDLEEVVVDASPFIFSQLIIWIIFLVLIRYYVKDIKKHNWE